MCLLLEFQLVLERRLDSDSDTEGLEEQHSLDLEESLGVVVVILEPEPAVASPCVDDH